MLNFIFVIIISYAGLASHYVPSHRLPDLYERLSCIEDSDPKVFSDAIDEFSEPGSASFSLDPLLPVIQE